MKTRTFFVCLCSCLSFAIPILAQQKGAHEPIATTKQPVLNGEHDPVPQTPAPLPAAAVNAFNAAEARHEDHLDALYEAMKEYNRSADGTLYSLTDDNALDSDWIQQTPNVWGKKAVDVKPGAGYAVAAKVRALVGSAQKFVDITSLSPFPTGQFQSAIIEGLQQIARSGRHVTVRILVGWYPGITGDTRINQSTYLTQFIDPLQKLGGNLEIYAGVIQPVGLQDETLVEWNHAKMVAVDGQRGMIGGENLWDADYLQSYPAHDVNVALTGSFVLGMHKFADKLWGEACSYHLDIWKSVSWKSGWSKVEKHCLATNGLSHTVGPGKVRVLGAGRLGVLMHHGNAADVGLALVLRTSTSTIRLAQQDLGSTDPLIHHRFWWDEGMTSLAKALVAKQHVYIVLSSDHATAGPGPNPNFYWNGIPLTKTADTIKEYVQKQAGAPNGAELRDLLCNHLHLAPVRFSTSDNWPNLAAFANHSKFLMIDDRLFYVGSENFYPVSLQEYGVFINDATAAKQMKSDYWDKLWQYSQAAAISGNGTEGCHFK